MKYAILILALVVACGPPERDSKTMATIKLIQIDDRALLFIMSDPYFCWPEIRFFDITDGDVYPDPPDYLGAGTYSLVTQYGHVICYGAETPSDGKSHGLGLDGTGECDNCCITEGWLEKRFYCE